MISSRCKSRCGLSPVHQFCKRTFDLLVALIGLALFGWMIIVAFIAASIDTRKNGFFRQVRVGRHGQLFEVIKIRTMRDHPGITTVVTTVTDPRITPLGRFFRTTKIDELPQLINVLFGQMSLVGPRPDVPGFADQLLGEDRIILTIRPGITGPATLRFRREEEELAHRQDPERYNREVVFPEKVRLNRAYIENYRFTTDLKYVFRTVFGP